MNNVAKIFFIFLFLFSPVSAFEIDSTAKFLIQNNPQKPSQNLNYNYQSTLSIPIKLNAVQKLKDKNLFEGQKVEFRVKDNVAHNGNIILKKDEIVTARVETLVTNGMNGIPASIVFGNFSAPYIEQKKISQKYEHFGLDLSLFVFPLKWALTPLPPTGSLTNFIKGGRATLSEGKTIVIYYYPEW